VLRISKTVLASHIVRPGLHRIGLDFYGEPAPTTDQVVVMTGRARPEKVLALAREGIRGSLLR
jgi:hypothetical protein